MSAKPLAVVTGASGYLGRALCHELDTHQWAVRRCSRRDRACDSQGAWVRDDPENHVIKSDLFEQADTVFHLAGLAHQHHSISPQAYARANVGYTQSVATRAAQAGVRHFVFVSSVAAVADHTTGLPVTPDSDPAPQTAYGRSKLAAEQAIRQIIDPTPMTWTILRPPLIYGVHPKGNLRPLLRLSRLAMPLPFGAIDNKRSMVSLNNLTDLIIRSADQNFPGKNRVLMPADICLSTPALISALRTANGAPPRLFNVPDAVYDWLAKLPVIGRRAQVLRTSLQIDDPWLRQTLGWRGPHLAQEQIHAMATCA